MTPQRSDQPNENTATGQSRNRSQSEDQQIAEALRALRLYQASLESLSYSVLSMRQLVADLASDRQSNIARHRELSGVSSAITRSGVKARAK
jgi:hypothetical protein